jgi:hypothetical protein
MTHHNMLGSDPALTAKLQTAFAALNGFAP